LPVIGDRIDTLCHETDAVIKDENARRRGLVQLVSTITMSPCSRVGGIKSPLIVINRNLSAGRITSPACFAAL